MGAMGLWALGQPPKVGCPPGSGYSTWALGQPLPGSGYSTWAHGTPLPGGGIQPRGGSL